MKKCVAVWLFLMGSIVVRHCFGFVAVTPFFECLSSADAVVIAKPVKLDRIVASESVEYELGTFQLIRTLSRGVRSVSDVNQPTAFCMFRLYYTDGMHFKKFDFEIGKPYILALSSLEADGCYQPLSYYHPFHVATKDNLKKAMKALFGKEEERIAEKAMSIDAAIEYGEKIMKETATRIKSFEEKGDDIMWKFFNMSRGNQRKYLHSPFLHLSEDDRVVLVKVKGDLKIKYSRGTMSFSEFEYCALRPDDGYGNDGSYGFGDPVEIQRDENSECTFKLIRLWIDEIALGETLCVERVITTIRGKRNIKCYLKIKAGLVGEEPKEKSARGLDK